MYLVTAARADSLTLNTPYPVCHPKPASQFLTDPAGRIRFHDADDLGGGVGRTHAHQHVDVIGNAVDD